MLFFKQNNFIRMRHTHDACHILNCHFYAKVARYSKCIYLKIYYILYQFLTYIFRRLFRMGREKGKPSFNCYFMYTEEWSMGQGSNFMQQNVIRELWKVETALPKNELPCAANANGIDLFKILSWNTFFFSIRRKSI